MGATVEVEADRDTGRLLLSVGEHEDSLTVESGSGAGPVVLPLAAYKNHLDKLKKTIDVQAPSQIN